jgi:hypothetical protein
MTAGDGGAWCSSFPVVEEHQTMAEQETGWGERLVWYDGRVQVQQRGWSCEIGVEQQLILLRNNGMQAGCHFALPPCEKQAVCTICTQQQQDA